MTASFDQYGLKITDTYLKTVGAVTKEKIMEQKWIALFGQGLEAWTEYRRTGLPVLPAKDPGRYLRTMVFCLPVCLTPHRKYPSMKQITTKA